MNIFVEQEHINCQSHTDLITKQGHIHHTQMESFFKKAIKGNSDKSYSYMHVKFNGRWKPLDIYINTVDRSGVLHGKESLAIKILPNNSA